MTSEDVTVDLRLAQTPDGKLKAFADVVIDLGDGGEINIFGFSVIGDGKVVPPARMGKQRWFDVVILSGKVKQIVCARIANAYQDAIAKQKASAT